MNRSELIFNLLSIPMDLVALISASIVAFYLRLHSERFVGPVLYQLTLNDLLTVILKVAPILILVFALLSLYKLRGTRRFIHEFNRIIVGTSLSVLFAIVLFFFNQSIFPSRFIILVAWFLGTLFILIGRLILKRVQEFFFTHNYGLHRLVVINGQGSEAEVIQRFLLNPSHGYKVVGELTNSDRVVSELEELVSRDAIDGVIQANPRASDEQNLSLVEFCRQKGLQFSFVPNLFEVQRNIIELDNFQGVPVIKLKNTPLDGWGKVAKRIVDIAASLICLIITLPLFLVIYLVIRIDSSGPGIYWHIRAGQKKNFKFYKFRTMYTHLSQGEKFGSDQAEQVLKELLEKNKDGSRSGPLWKVKDDPRVTRIGRFLRRTKLDELPQFWNVLKGDMSMVGPRAHMVEQVEQYKNSYGRIFSIKPGIFGLTQIAQISWPTLPFEEEIKLDIYYIENWSLWWDIKILFKSAYTLFFAPKPRDDY